jgi:hypothetical protein
MANRHVHFLFRGATASSGILSGTNSGGRLATTSVMVSRQRPSEGHSAAA